MSSWDRFQVPLPPARVVIRYGDPIEIPRHANRDQMEMTRQALQDALDRLTAEAEQEALLTGRARHRIDRESE